MAEITLVCIDDKSEGGLTVALSKEIVDMQDLLAFFSDACMAMGYSYVDRMAYSTARGETVWSKF